MQEFRSTIRHNRYTREFDGAARQIISALRETGESEPQFKPPRALRERVGGLQAQPPAGGVRRLRPAGGFPLRLVPRGGRCPPRFRTARVLAAHLRVPLPLRRAAGCRGDARGGRGRGVALGQRLGRAGAPRRGLVVASRPPVSTIVTCPLQRIHVRLLREPFKASPARSEGHCL